MEHSDDPTNAISSTPSVPRQQRWLLRIAGTWYFQWAIGVFAFLLASLKIDSIKRAFPACCWIGITNYPVRPALWVIDRGVAAFWFFAILWAILTFHRHKADDARAASVRDSSTRLAEDVRTVRTLTDALEISMSDAKRALEEVRYAVETLPSKEFRTSLSVRSASMYAILGTAMPRAIAKGEDSAATIRSLLNTLLILRRVYESNQSGRYGANVMIFVRAEDHPPHLAVDVLEKVREMAPDPNIPAIELSLYL